ESSTSVLLHLSASMTPHPPRSTLFPYTTLFRSAPSSGWSSRDMASEGVKCSRLKRSRSAECLIPTSCVSAPPTRRDRPGAIPSRSEEHTSELQSQSNLVCRLLLEKKNNKSNHIH